MSTEMARWASGWSMLTAVFLARSSLAISPFTPSANGKTASPARDANGFQDHTLSVRPVGRSRGLLALISSMYIPKDQDTLPHPRWRNGPHCQGWSCGGPHAQDISEQGDMPTHHRGDRWPGLPPWLRRRRAERQGKPNPIALGRQIPWPVLATSWAGFGADPGEVGDIRTPGRRFKALSTRAQGQGNATFLPPAPPP